MLIKILYHRTLKSILLHEIVFVQRFRCSANYSVGFEENRLSSFSMDKIDKDFESIMRLVGNPKVNKNKKISNALINYRLQALIIYRLIKGYYLEIDNNILLNYFNKYKKNIIKPTFNNGLRSIKLNLNRIKLLYVFSRLAS